MLKITHTFDLQITRDRSALANYRAHLETRGVADITEYYEDGFTTVVVYTQSLSVAHACASFIKAETKTAPSVVCQTELTYS